MTIKEAILKSMEDIKHEVTYMDVYNHILKTGYYDFGSAKTPSATISALLGDFIRHGDTRIKRIKQTGGSYTYYLAKYEQDIPLDVINQPTDLEPKKSEKIKTYDERDLHKLLSSYLKNAKTYSKTIFHEQSTGKDNNQIWTHPDMVGVKFSGLTTKPGQSFMRYVNHTEMFKLSSYELKKEINSDTDLKKAFFQAVSNSSWANYGYLVAFEFGDALKEEMERLNQSFGIGIIELSANPYQSKVLLPSKYRELDFKTIDKLCNINSEFAKFIEQVEKLMTAEERYYKSTEKELDEFCDSYFANDSEVEEYCKAKHIPVEQE
ncbi:MAG TPA: hypothetical protein VG603_01680 [Chitinophagales bacterium]|nr:hypothetical protein [Chitinophagales bacterium]